MSVFSERPVTSPWHFTANLFLSLILESFNSLGFDKMKFKLSSPGQVDLATGSSLYRV